ncbi:hypothetical protein Psch_03481 [Pelotomaculum schinkii]|uniref:Uncharacterized protein n=1 Tax=Pelotomaculum schinkii TaxID=78350 RepID=A0A4Y7R7M4_9FIRM|nr:hypothetical protein [Pelotomaculum schinkii]TEB04719.1 hypothetical protein Psch_03481 [Pelotomaculum schinkii]
MLVFSTLGNKEIEDRILSMLPNGVKFSGEMTDDCEAAFLVARSLSAGVGVKNVREWLNKITEKEIPCLVMARDTALIDYAKEKGFANENIISGVRISIKEIVQKFRDVLCADDYEIVLDNDNNYLIDLDETCEENFTAYKEPAFRETPSPEHVFNSNIQIPDTTGLISAAVFVGVKGGVGTSTVAAMACDTMDESLHLEIAGENRLPSAYCYYGRDPESMRESYVFWELAKERPPLNDHRVALLDISSSVPVGAADTLIEAAGCLVMVTDRSEIAFELTGKMLRAGFKPDILVVSAAMSGIGNGMEVYLGEYEDLLQGVQVLELPGSLDEEKAIARAQRNGEAPCGGGRSVSLDTFAGELTSAIRNVLGI